MPEKRRQNLAETKRWSSYNQEEWLEEFLDDKGAFYNGRPPRWDPPWCGEGAYLTKRLHPVYQQKEPVAAMLPHSSQTGTKNRSS